MRNVDKRQIITNEDLDLLVYNVENNNQFAIAFEFETDDLRDQFLERIGCDTNEFHRKYYFFDGARNLHISESEEGFVWISTMGLVAMSKATENRLINSLDSQKLVLIHLLDDAIALTNSDESYDVDSYKYSQVQVLTHALFQHTIFYCELLAKAYLSVNSEAIPHIHNLAVLLERLKHTMYAAKQNDTLFHANVIPWFEQVVKHISSIPGNFNEAYVKYDDNPDDITRIRFHYASLREMRDLVSVSHDMVTEMYYNAEQPLYFRTGLYSRLLEKCDTDEERNRVKTIYSFLLDESL